MNSRKGEIAYSGSVSTTTDGTDEEWDPIRDGYVSEDDTTPAATTITSLLLDDADGGAPTTKAYASDKLSDEYIPSIHTHGNGRDRRQVTIPGVPKPRGRMEGNNLVGRI